MRIIDATFFIESTVNGEKMLKAIERAGRTAYKSEDKITEQSARAFVAKIVRLGHESVLEHQSVTVRVVCDRGVTHEIVRHRLASYTQESTRYCNYSTDKFSNEITVIRPCFWKEGSKEFDIWKRAMEEAERAYLELMETGATPQQARSALPNSLKTELVMTLNLRAWRHFFRLRCARSAHPQMREIAVPLLARFQKLIPAVFDDLEGE